MPNCDKRVYGLWFQMLRRCYDTTQHEREKGKSYADCEVCDRWKMLSCFAKDIKKLEGCVSMTNAQKIRAMSDEEMCNWLFQRDCTNIAAFLEHGGMGVMDAVQLLEWLKQPAE